MYVIIERKESIKPYGIFKRAHGFWRQVGNWYVNKACATKKLKELKGL